MTLIDLVMVVLWNYWANGIEVGQGTAVAMLVVFPTLILIVGLVAVGLIFRKKNWLAVAICNVFIVSLSFIMIVRYNYHKQHNDNYKVYGFEEGKNNFEIIINLNGGSFQDSLPYAVYDQVSKYSKSGTDFNGRYYTRNDTVFLSAENGNLMKIFNDTLFNFHQQGDILILGEK